VDQPIACSLTATEAAARAAQTARIAERALIDRTAVEGGQRLRFAGGQETEAAVREIVAAEAECCPFLEMELRGAGGELELDITGPPEAQPIVEALFASRA
jgi:hypothetical protein